MLRHCVNLKAIRYESTSLNRIAADKTHRVIVALHGSILIAICLATLEKESIASCRRHVTDCSLELQVAMFSKIPCNLWLPLAMVSKNLSNHWEK